MARYVSAPGVPPTVAHSIGATCASDVFSATDSNAARARPAPSSRSGSRPHSDGSSRRAAAMSSRSSSSAICTPVRANEVPPNDIQAAVAVAAIEQSRPSRRAAPCAATPNKPTAPTSRPTWAAPAILLSR